MSYVNIYNLKAGKRYSFCTRFDLMKNIDDLMPHYYKATYVGTERQSVWIFKEFIDQDTNETASKKEIKHFGVNYELVCIEEDVDAKTAKKPAKKEAKKTAKKTAKK